ncbi:TPA: hypothetical protein DIS55_02080 [Candidatus Kaiserbacteria bacterium]|uniref:Uncharacterized protein n=3 Tax=Candidatus Kaiseribacteriota TaxID=1752734 RepID=A0A1F6FNC0_9BACT|nr:MAG: hypothetical protein A3H15_01575 [Candidatus Kaiserbacteria bacterium RIFCSPLOWO2_12_FULL_50_28]HCM43718.1 hypothetical protein [Candidatus Kaiserbacteria bacterium]
MNTTSVSGKIITIIAIAAFVVATGAFAFSLTVSSENGISVASIAYAWGDGSSGGCCGGDRGGDPGGGREPDFNPPIVYNPKPSCSISTNPSNIQAGGSSTLFWGSTNATSASINKGIGSVPTHGSRGVSPSITKTYTLTVYGPGGTANCQTTVTVQPQQAPSCTISANPSSVQYGGSSTLTWNSTNATSASINQGIGSIALNGSNVVSSLLTTRTYTMTVTGPGGTANCQTTVTVQPQQAPSCTISANPSSVQYGGSSTLTWNSTNATSANLTGVGSVATNGSHSVLNIYGTTTYTLNVTGPGGSTDCQTTVYTSQIPAPSCTINANPSSVQQGGTSYLSWSSTNATSANLSSVGSVGVNGNYTVYPYTTTTYILTVYGSQGQSSQCQTTVSVGTVYNQPPSCWITLTPQYGYGGSSYYNRPSTLSWGSTNVTSAYISPNIGTISSYGSQTVYTSDSNQIYTMTASGPGGTATCRTQQVYIPNPPVYPPYITLTQIPYTGLDLGIVGNGIYWFSILAFALAAGYLAVYYLPALAGIKARVPIRAMEAPMIFAKSVATSVPFVRNTIENHAGWMPQDSMTFARAENGRAPRIVITRK